tara:strand:+ start:189 stop:407 length:219 start_codon:yes stop_codon:yes gene_type:complete
MKKAVAELTEWISTFVDLMKILVALGVVVGILFDDYFGVIGNIGSIMSSLGEKGLAGLVALGILVAWYKPSK